jgi:hypothetical protein
MKHTLKGNATTLQVWLDGKPLAIKPSQKVHNHASEFNWGYGGSGPGQLALAVVLKLTGSSDGYIDFKFNTIAALPGGKDFEIEFEMDTTFNHAKA